jgi:hypothetical protein
MSELGNAADQATRTSRLSATTTNLLALALADDVGALVLVGSHAKVLDSLAVVARTAEEDGVGAGGGAQGQLVESESLSAPGEDASAGGGREAEGSDRETFGEDVVLDADVIGNGAHDDDGLLGVGGLAALAACAHLARNARQRERRPVRLRQEQPLRRQSTLVCALDLRFGAP